MYTPDEVRKMPHHKIKALSLCALYGWGTRIHVCSAYSPQFVHEAMQLRGKWKKRSQAWSFRGVCKEAVLESCRHIYGADKVFDLGPRRPQHED